MLIETKNADTHPKPHTKLFPVFVPSKTMLNGDIPVTPIGKDGRRDDVGNDPPWSKKSGKLYWVSRSTHITVMSAQTDSQQGKWRPMAQLAPRATSFPRQRPDQYVSGRPESNWRDRRSGASALSAQRARRVLHGRQAGRR